LDWSESPLVATYFAVKSNPDKDGMLWVLLPLEFNIAGGRIWDDPDHLPSFQEDDEFMESYSPENYNKEKNAQMLPIAFIAPRNTPRMQFQSSVFTIHHRNKIAVEDVEPKTHVWRYRIPKEYKKDIRLELRLLGIGKFQLFPELQTIGDILKGEE